MWLEYAVKKWPVQVHWASETVRREQILSQISQQTGSITNRNRHEGKSWDSVMPLKQIVSSGGYDETTYCLPARSGLSPGLSSVTKT